MKNPNDHNQVYKPPELSAVQKAIKQFRSKDTLFLTDIFQKTKIMPSLRIQLDFMQVLFSKHMSIIKQMVGWTFMPKLTAKRLKITQGIPNYTYKSKQFLKDNWCFHQQVLRSIKKRELSVSMFLDFLAPQNFDEETVDTALGYFSEIMVPLAKYQYSESEDELLGVLSALSEEDVGLFMKYCDNKPVFEFLKTSVLVGLESTDIRQLDMSTRTLQKLFKYCQVDGLFQSFEKNEGMIEFQEQCLHVRKLANLQENMATTLEQLVYNLQSSNSRRLSTRYFTIVDSMIESSYISYAVKQLLSCRWCNETILPILSSITDFVKSSIKSLQVSSVYSSKEYSKITEKSKFLTHEITDQEIVEPLVRILKVAVQIYLKIPKALPPEQSVQLDYDQITLEMDDPKVYATMIKAYQQQIQFLLDNMPALTQILSKSYPIHQTKFTSGQTIKPITIMKYQCLYLLYHCLVLLQENDIVTLQKKQIETQSFIGSQSSILRKSKQQFGSWETKMPSRKTAQKPPQGFSLDVQKLHVIEIIEKYLLENRWNNIAHHMLQKICHALIISRYEYILKDIKKDYKKKLTDSFLAFLVQNFTEKDYIYLQTMRCTSQGNLHSIYNISKYLAFSLNKNNQLVQLLKEFGPWMKFLEVDLATYEENAYKYIVQPSEKDSKQINRQSSKQDQTIKVDQVQSIRQLVQDVYEERKKWPSYHKNISKSVIQRNSMFESSISGKMYQSMNGYGKNMAEKCSQRVSERGSEGQTQQFSSKNWNPQLSTKSVILRPGQKKQQKKIFLSEIRPKR